MSAVLLNEVKNLKIVPENYISATVFTIQEIENGVIKIDLPRLSSIESLDYEVNGEVEAFGLDRHGLVYFTSKILEKNGTELKIEYPKEIKEIQRRKYTRVPFDGNLVVIGEDKIQTKTDDISAGGLKFISDTPFMVGNEYEIKVELANNLVIECTMQPIRVEENDEEDEKFIYSVSAKFKKIRSIDRIALMQYSLRCVSEFENKA